jgi:hypothetical protein
MWPTTTETPPVEELRSNAVLVEKKQEHFLKEFHNALLVSACPLILFLVVCQPMRYLPKSRVILEQNYDQESRLSRP